MLAGHRDLDLLGQHLLLSGGGRDVDVRVVVDLVTLPHVLDDVKVGPGCFCQAVLQNPTIRLRVWVPQPKNVLHGRLQVTDSRQNQQLVEKEKHGVFSVAWTAACQQIKARVSKCFCLLGTSTLVRGLKGQSS